MRRCGRSPLVWLALSAGACLAGCSPDGVSEFATGWPIGKSPGEAAAIEVTHSIPIETKLSEKKQNKARKDQRITGASQPKPRGPVPAVVAPTPAEPKAVRSERPDPELRLRTCGRTHRLPEIFHADHPSLIRSSNCGRRLAAGRMRVGAPAQQKAEGEQPSVARGQRIRPISAAVNSASTSMRD